jgi:hypothetical protein
MWPVCRLLNGHSPLDISRRSPIALSRHTQLRHMREGFRWGRAGRTALESAKLIKR